MESRQEDTFNSKTLWEPHGKERRSGGSSMHTAAHLRRQLFSLTSPIFVELLLIMLLSAVDVIMLSQHSDNAVAAVGVDAQILNMVFLVFEVFTAGTTVLCARYRGARDPENVTRIIGISLLFNGISGLAVSAALAVFAEPVLSLMGIRADLMADAASYMRIVGGMAFLQGLAFTISAVLRSMEMASNPMLVTLLMNLLNMAGNYTLIFGHFGAPALGVTGAAISTSACRAVALCLLAFILFRKGVRIPLRLFRPFPFGRLKELLAIGLPAAGEFFSYQFSQLVITFFINKLGNEALAARTYCVNIIMFSYLFASAIGQGGSILVGWLIGRHRIEAAYRMGRFCFRAALAVTVSISAVTALLGRFIVPLLTGNPEIIHLCVIILFVDILLEFGRPVNILAGFMLRSASDSGYVFLVGVTVMWSVATALSYVFGITLGWGLIGMWAAFTLDELIRALLLARRWRSMKWAEKFRAPAGSAA